jgi:hypothetical protein
MCGADVSSFTYVWGQVLLYQVFSKVGFVVTQVTPRALGEPVADAWLLITAFFVFGHVAILSLQYGFVLSMVWFIKFVTDPFTDLPSYKRALIDIFTTKDWQTASLKTLLGHLNKETAGAEDEVAAAQ